MPIPVNRIPTIRAAIGVTIAAISYGGSESPAVGTAASAVGTVVSVEIDSMSPGSLS